MRFSSHAALWLALAMAASTVLALPAAAQEFGVYLQNTVSPVKGPITGYVRGEGAEGPFFVRLETSTGSLVDQTRTTGSGWFELQNVACGSYVLAVNVPGYKPVRRMVEHSYEPLDDLSIYLVPDETQMAQANGASPSLRQLLVPADAREEYNKGLEAVSKKKIDEVVKRFRQAIEIYPDYDDAYLQLSLVHFQQGAYAEAQLVLEEALQANDENARAHALLGTVYQRQNRLRDSAVALRRSLELKESYWRAHLELAKTLLHWQKVEDAYPHVLRAHQLNPRASSTHVLLYNALILRKDYAAAMVELEEFIQLFPEHSLASRAQETRKELAQSLAGQEP